MTDKETAAQPKRTFSSNLVDLRNGAIIIAALAFAFHWATEGAHFARKPEISVGEIKLPTQQATPSEPAHEVPTAQITAEIKSRVDTVKASAPVVLKSLVQARANAPVATAQRAGEQQASDDEGRRAVRLGFKPDGTEMNAEEKREQIKNLMSALPEFYTVNWVAPEEKTSIFVFSDPTCGYCRKLHESIPALNKAGITVRYLMYPRDLPTSTETSLSPTAQNLNNIWCSADQKSAFDEAFAGYRVKEANCNDLPEELNRIASPMLDHYFLGTLFDVRGTPTIITIDGLKIEGFSSAPELIRRVIPN